MADIPIEKAVNFDQLERAETKESVNSDKLNDARIAAFTPEEQKKIIRRIDRRLVLTLGFLYCVSLMDRTNLGIAVVAGMGVDLVLTGNRYSVIVLLFFITYVLLQPPATVVLRKVGPRVFLPTITLLWGITMICFGFVKDWSDLIPLRLVLGVFEAGFFPGCAYLLSCWYPRYELQKRNAVFYLIGSMASAFSGILAYGFSQLKNHGSGPKWWGQHYGPTAANPTAPSGILPGIAGWRWIFILQGVITALLALASYVLIVDFPELSTNTFGLKFLNKAEADFVVARIEKDRHDAIPEQFRLGKYLKNALDLKVWGFAALFGLSTTNTYAIAYFLPIILNSGMGFNVAASQCLVAPPYVLAAIVMYAFAVLGDRWHLRSPFILINGALLLIGLPLLGYLDNVGVRYFGVFIATTACNANVPCVLTWQANNIRGQWKRALCSATLVGAGGIGGIIGSTVFREQDKPEYHPGILTCMIASGLIILITLALDFKFWRANKRAAAGGKPIEGLQGFFYTY
ncbi:High-affinity nicotinic acid transporter [Exophiala dermatitidis]